MPFSWKKKTRCTRFSQLVADHLQSPKRGGSLVVETGFPTSLIDLYVRNRGRFSKPSVKKQRENESRTSLSTSTSFSSDLLANPNNSSSGVSDYIESDEIIEEDTTVVGVMVPSDDIIEIENPPKSEVEKRAEMVKLNPVLVAALKVLFMFVLALGTKKFTVGITLSAFLLFFLESVVKPLFRRSSPTRPSVDSETLFQSDLHETKIIDKSKENTTLVVCNEVSEIEKQVESKEEVRSEKDLDEVRSDVSMEIRHKTSRRAILKSRMKKLVLKKLHKSSMVSKGESEISHGFKEEETVKCNQDRQPIPICTESSDSKGEILSVLKQEQDKIVEIEGRCSSSSLSLLSEIDNKDSERGIQQNSGYLVLCLIVLIGLIGGRILALLLALSWCFLLKKSQWRNVKFPIS